MCLTVNELSVPWSSTWDWPWSLGKWPQYQYEKGSYCLFSVELLTFIYKIWPARVLFVLLLTVPPGPCAVQLCIVYSKCSESMPVTSSSSWRANRCWWCLQKKKKKHYCINNGLYKIAFVDLFRNIWTNRLLFFFPRSLIRSVVIS